MCELKYDNQDIQWKAVIIVQIGLNTCEAKSSHCSVFIYICQGGVAFLLQQYLTDDILTVYSRKSIHSALIQNYREFYIVAFLS